jgi:quercetin dioxygenase-like cupin family protein
MADTHDPIARARYRFHTDTDADGTEVQHVEAWVEPGGGVPPHLHPHYEEVFEVVEGEVTFTVGRERRRAGPGETATVPPGTRHAFANRSDSSAHMRVRARPASDLQQFLEDIAALGRAGYIARLGPVQLPKTPRAALQLSLLLREYRPETLILMPPPLVQRLFMDPLAHLAERRGYGGPGVARTL